MLANAGYSLCSNNLKIATAIIAQQPVHIPDHIASFHHDSRKPSKTNSFTLYEQRYKYIGVSPGFFHEFKISHFICHLIYILYKGIWLFPSPKNIFSCMNESFTLQTIHTCTCTTMILSSRKFNAHQHRSSWQYSLIIITVFSETSEEFISIKTIFWSEQSKQWAKSEQQQNTTC